MGILRCLCLVGGVGFLVLSIVGVTLDITTFSDLFSPPAVEVGEIWENKAFCDNPGAPLDPWNKKECFDVEILEIKDGWVRYGGGSTDTLRRFTDRYRKIKARDDKPSPERFRTPEEYDIVCRSQLCA